MLGFVLGWHADTPCKTIIMAFSQNSFEMIMIMMIMIMMMIMMIMMMKIMMMMMMIIIMMMIISGTHVLQGKCTF